MRADDELLAAWQAGDNSAAAQLIERYSDDLYRFFVGKVGTETEDLVQQTFLGCLEHGRAHGSMRSFRGFVFGVARHRLIDHFRSRARTSQIDPAVTSLVDVATSPSGRLARDRQERCLLAALRTLPIDAQLVLELYYWQSLTGPELADALDVPEGTARSRLRKAKQRLVEALAHTPESSLNVEDTLTRLADWRPNRE